MSKLFDRVKSLFKLSGTQALPGTESLSFARETMPGERYQYTCPDNGYLTVSCSARFVWLSVRYRNGAVQDWPDRYSCPTAGAYPCTTLPVTKGLVVEIAVGIESSYTDQPTETYIRFSKLQSASA